MDKIDRLIDEQLAKRDANMVENHAKKWLNVGFRWLRTLDRKPPAFQFGVGSAGGL